MLYYVSVILSAPCPRCGVPIWFDWDDGERQSWEHPGTPGEWVPATGAPLCADFDLLTPAEWKVIDTALCEAVELVSEEEGRLAREHEAALAAEAEGWRREDAGPVLAGSSRTASDDLEDLPF